MFICLVRQTMLRLCRSSYVYGDDLTEGEIRPSVFFVRKKMILSSSTACVYKSLLNLQYRLPFSLTYNYLTEACVVVKSTQLRLW